MVYYALEKCLWLAVLAAFVSAAPTPVEGVYVRPSANLVTVAHEGPVGITNLLQSEDDSNSPFSGVSPFGDITTPFGKNGWQLAPASDSSDHDSNINTSLDSGSPSKAAESDSFGHSTTAVPTHSADPTSAVPPATFVSETLPTASSVASDPSSGSGELIGLRHTLVRLTQGPQHRRHR